MPGSVPSAHPSARRTSVKDEQVFDTLTGVEARRERAALVALLRQRGRRWSEVTDEVEAAGSARAVLLAGTAQGQLFDDSDESSVALAEAERDVAAWEAEGMRLVSMLEPGYPAQLLSIHQRPPFVMYRGVLDPGDALGVAIVGTREPSPRGVEQAAAIARGVANRGVPVISGLAAGIDTAALTASLDSGGRTIAVIGTGLRRSYPKGNEELQSRIAREGAVISQFWPDAPPTKTSFPMRNAVMSGYAAATVVVEAAWRSGARMQARLALEHGRTVFLLDSLLQHDWARDYAERPGVFVVSSADDVIESLERITSPVHELTWS